MSRKVCVITGTRADYGILYPVMKAITNSPNLDLYIIATGMHLMKEFGYTVKEIERDGFRIFEKLDIFYKNDTGKAMANSTGKAIMKFSGSLAILKPDIMVVLGDRGEMLAAAIAANYLSIPVAHIHGGEISGHVDGVFRHAITKLSHLHFAATKKSYERILRLGEEPWRVFLVGAPSLDTILKSKITDSGGLKKYGIDCGKPYILVVQHPVLEEKDKAEMQIKITLEAVKEFKLSTIIIYPNADAGGRRMIKIIQRYCHNHDFMKCFASIPHEDYLGLLKISAVLIGNSSSGIIEAPVFKIPVINIGSRQEGRERSGNIIDVGYDKEMISRAVKKTLSDEKFRLQIKNCENAYGDGHAGRRIAKILSEADIGKKLLHKQMTY